MILLDENIAEDQFLLLRSWRIRCRQIGQDVGRQGMKDDQEIVPLLRKLSQPTLITRDLGFFDRTLCHDHYAIACLAIAQNEVARFVRRFLCHPHFNTRAKRLGAIIRVGPLDLRVWRLRSEKEQRFSWPKRRRK